jgi:hypothetical protein
MCTSTKYYTHFKPDFESGETCARTRPFANQKSNAIFIEGKEILKVASTKFLMRVIFDEKSAWLPSFSA